MTLVRVLDYLQAMIVLALSGQLHGIHFWGSAYVLMVMVFTLGHVLNVRRWPHTPGQLLQ